MPRQAGARARYPLRLASGGSTRLLTSHGCAHIEETLARGLECALPERCRRSPRPGTRLPADRASAGTPKHREAAHVKENDDALRSTGGDAGRRRGYGCLRTGGIGVHGRSGPVPGRGHPVHPRGSRAGRRARRRRPCTGHGETPGLHRPERAWRRQLRLRHRGGVLGALPGRGHHARNRVAGHRHRRLPGAGPDAHCSRRRPSSRCASTVPSAWANWHAAASTGPSWNWARRIRTSPATTSTGTSRTRSSRPPIPWEPGRPPRADIEKAVGILKGARYPVIVSGGGVSQGDAVDEVRAAGRAPERAGGQHLPATTTPFPYSHELGCGPIGYCGSKAAMRTIAKADVVLALGTRLGVFGLLPQYDMTYWPEDATLIQVDRDARQWGMSRIPALFSVADVGEYAAELLEELKRGAAEPGAERRAHRGCRARKAGLGRRTRGLVLLHRELHASAALPLGVHARASRGCPGHHGHRQHLLDQQRVSQGSTARGSISRR